MVVLKMATTRMVVGDVGDESSLQEGGGGKALEVSKAGVGDIDSGKCRLGGFGRWEVALVRASLASDGGLMEDVAWGVILEGFSSLMKRMEGKRMMMLLDGPFEWSFVMFGVCVLLSIQ